MKKTKKPKRTNAVKPALMPIAKPAVTATATATATDAPDASTAEFKAGKDL